MTARAHPPFDVELESALGAVPGFFTTLEPDSIAEFRAATTRPSSLDEVIAGRPVQVTVSTPILQRNDRVVLYLGDFDL